MWPQSQEPPEAGVGRRQPAYHLGGGTAPATTGLWTPGLQSWGTDQAPICGGLSPGSETHTQSWHHSPGQLSRALALVLRITRDSFPQRPLFSEARGRGRGTAELKSESPSLARGSAQCILGAPPYLCPRRWPRNRFSAPTEALLPNPCPLPGAYSVLLAWDTLSLSSPT